MRPFVVVLVVVFLVGCVAPAASREHKQHIHRHYRRQQQQHQHQHQQQETRKYALLVIDVQNDFLPSGFNGQKGALAVDNANDVIPVINKLRSLRAWDVVAMTKDWHPAGHVSFASAHPGHKEHEVIPVGAKNTPQMLWPDHCIAGSPGAEFHKDLMTLPTDIVVEKGNNKDVDSYSGFFDNDHATKTALEAKLKEKGITDLYVTGIAYDYCVGSSAIDAASVGFKTTVIEDAAKGVKPETTAAMRAKLLLNKVTIASSAEVIAKQK